MYRYLVEHKRLLVLFLIIFLAFLWMTHQIKQGDKLGVKRLSDNLLSPPQKVITVLANRVRGFLDHYLFLVGKAKENKSLIEEIEKLKTEVGRYQDVLEENKRLKTLLSLKESQSTYIATVRVIGRDPGNWFRTIVVDKGEKDGLKKDMTAISHSGIVGRIYKVMPGTAKILLITDHGSSLAARVLRTRDEGILEGTVGGLCRLKYIRQSSEIKVGDVLLSSGLDGVFPKGLIIGTVSKVERKKSGFFQEIDVTPSTDITKLEEVIIVGQK